MGGASYGHDIREFEKKVDGFANVVWWSTYQQILKRIGQPCFRTVLHQINQSKFYLKSVHFITIQHKLSRAFQTDMHNKIT